MSEKTGRSRFGLFCGCLKGGEISRHLLAILLLGLGIHPLAHGAPTSKHSENTIGDMLKGISKTMKKESEKRSQNRSQIPKMAEEKAPVTTKRDLLRIKPPKSSVLTADPTSLEAEYEKTIDVAIKELYELVKKFEKSKNRDKLWLRLAEQYVEKGKILETRLQLDYEQALKRFQSGESKREPVLNLQPTRVFYLKAIDLYKFYLRDFPKGDKVDQALYFLGYTHFELGNVKVGSEYYNELSRRFPKSPFVQESQFALADHKFDNERWDEAYELYEKVVQSRNERLYQLALYKLAWSAYKKGKNDIALKHLEKVIRYSAQVDREQTVRKMRLINEASKDLVSFYAQTGRFDNAESYFSGLVGKKRTLTMLEQLAYHYSDSGHREGTLFLFKRLISENPTAEKAFDYQKQIVTVFATSGQSKIFNEELHRWVNDYGPSSEWAEHNSKNTEVVSKAHEDMEKNFRRYIQDMHRGAQNTRLSGVQKRTHEEYLLYIEKFPSALKIDEMHFFHGELLYDMQQYQLASVEYLWVTQHRKDSKYFEKAFLNAVLANQQLLPSEQEIKRRALQESKEIAMEPSVKQYIEVSEDYLSAFPKSDRAAEINFHIGVLYYSYHQNSKALKVLTQLVERFPNSTQSMAAAHLVLDIFNREENYEALENSGRKFLAIPAIRNNKVGQQIQDVVEKAGFKKAQLLEGDKQYVESAKAYEQFAQKNPTSKLSTSALFNAAINNEKGGNLSDAMKQYHVVASRKSEKDLSKKSTQLLARLYQVTGQYAKAAFQFEHIEKEFPNEPASRDMLYNAAVIWDGLRYDSKAIEGYKKYIGLAKKSDDRAKAYFLLGQIYRRQKNYGMAIHNFKNFLQETSSNKENIIEAHWRIAKLASESGRSSEETQWWHKTVDIQKRLGGSTLGVRYAAEAQFNLALPNLAELKKISIPADPAMQASALKRKIGLIDRMNQQFGEVIKYDVGEFIVASLTVLGQGYSHMYGAITQAPLPKGLGPDKIDEYRAAIEKMASPYREKAVANLKGAIDKSQKAEVVTHWVRDARVELDRYERNSGNREITKVLHIVDWMGL